MKFERDPDLVRWLEIITVSSSTFQWDRGNSTKNRKHNVTRDEIEELFHNFFTIVGKILEPYHPENRRLFLGETNRGRRLSLVFTVRDGLIRPISCRPMRKEEVRHYEKEKQRFADRRV